MKNTSRPKRASSWIDVPLMIFGQVVLFVMLVGMVFYVAAGYQSSNFDPFGLATVVGLLGGFSFVIAFSDKCSDSLRQKFRIIGVFYLFATISFVVFGIYQPVDKLGVPGLDWLLVLVIPASFYLGTLSFIGALLLTLLSIPTMIKG